MELLELPNEEFKENFRNWLIEQYPKYFKNLSGYEILKSFIYFKYGNEIVFERKDFQFFVSFKREIIDEIKVWLESFQLTFEDYKIYFELFIEDLNLNSKTSFEKTMDLFNSFLISEDFIIEKNEINKIEVSNLFLKKIIENRIPNYSKKKDVARNCIQCECLLSEEELHRKHQYKNICIKCLDVKKRDYKKNYKILNPEKSKEQKRRYKKNRMKRDITFKILHRLRTRILLVLHGKKKAESSMNLLGCTAEHFKKHLESQFKDDMSWENYGIKGWHIDHIKPCSSFDLSIIEEQKECFHYTNLQPLWWHENLAKSNKIN
jgi:hypothetical protein